MMDLPCVDMLGKLIVSLPVKRIIGSSRGNLYVTRIGLRDVPV